MRILPLGQAGKLAVLASLLCAGLAASLNAASAPRAKAFVRQGIGYAEGRSIRLAGTRQQAELQALQEASDRLAEMLSKRGLGGKRELAEGIRDAVLRETDLKAFKIGKARIETVLQERRQGTDGRDEWSVHIKISVALP